MGVKFYPLTLICAVSVEGVGEYVFASFPAFPQSCGNVENRAKTMLVAERKVIMTEFKMTDASKAIVVKALQLNVIKYYFNDLNIDIETLNNERAKEKKFVWQINSNGTHLAFDGTSLEYMQGLRDISSARLFLWNGEKLIEADDMTDEQLLEAIKL